MKYSVLMSVYKNDDPAFLDVALKSVFEDQTRKPDEILIVIDGPIPEELSSVLNAFAQSHEEVVRLLPRQENKGLGEALRIGAEACTGDYIFRMDADDISDPLRFEKQIAYVEANPAIDVLGTDIAEFDQSPDEKNLRVRACPADHDGIAQMAKKRSPMNHVSVCIKKSALETAGGYMSLLLVEDYYLWLRMLAAGCRFANLNESLVYVRVGNGFDAKRGSNIRVRGWKVLQNYMVEHGMITRMRAFANMLSIRVFIYMPAFMRRFIYKTLLRR
ncbi:MAG: glycosyltransferase [Eggerthellaceae bacterium]|nr:glycosyltransferase [Eggerthellaceae bacterium]